MFDTVAMSRLTLAGPVSSMEEVLRACLKLGCVHIETYDQFEDGVGVGQAIDSTDANAVSALLTKSRAALSAYSLVNEHGPLPMKRVHELIQGDFPATLDEGLGYIDIQRESEAQMSTIQEQLKALNRLAPLNIDLELLTGSSNVEVYVAETSKASKATQAFSTIIQHVQLAHAPGIVAVACAPQHGAEVQIILGELGGKTVQIPNIKGSPAEVIKELEKQQSTLERQQSEAATKASDWAKTNGRDVLAIHEYLEKEDDVFTAPTLMAVTHQAFALDAWVPSSQQERVERELKSMVSHLEVEPYVDDHHHHGDDHHHHVEPPVKLENDAVSEPFELMVGLVGRPKYGTFDPTFFMMLTFPMIYGLILGDFGYGLIIFALGAWLGSKPMANDPVIANGITILKWMGIWCIIWGLLFAEGFGFLWDESWSPLHGVYAWTLKHIHFPGFVESLLNMSHTHIPFHRAGAALQDYVLLSVYLGVIHLFFGFVLGFINVMRGHGLVAAYFEKGSWVLILVGGFLHARRMVAYNGSLTEFSLWSAMILIGVVSLIIGLAVFEGFGVAGGLIMGPIETVGLLANTLSYLRVMGVGVAGVKIAEVSITMGWDLMMQSGLSNPIGLLLGLILFVFIQTFALALGLLSPSIHAARLHFVEWMGKFYDGTGRVFSPLGGRTLHTEGQS